MDERMTVKTCRQLLGAVYEGLTDEEVSAIRDGVYQFANVIADAHADIQNRSSDLQSNQVNVTELWLDAALGLSAKDIEQIEEDLARECDEQISEVLRRHAED